MSDAPKRIWLQWDGSADEDEVGEPYPPEVTWCQDRVFDRDVEYVRADEIERLKAELQLTRGAMVADDERLRAAAVKAGVTDFGCDTADHLADRILELQSVVDAARKAMNSGNPLDDVELRFAIRAYDEGRTG